MLLYFYASWHNCWTTEIVLKVDKPQSAETGNLRLEFICGARFSKSHSYIDVHRVYTAAQIKGGSFLRALCMHGRWISLWVILHFLQIFTLHFLHHSGVYVWIIYLIIYQKKKFLILSGKFDLRVNHWEKADYSRSLEENVLLLTFPQPLLPFSKQMTQRAWPWHQLDNPPCFYWII